MTTLLTDRSQKVRHGVHLHEDLVCRGDSLENSKGNNEAPTYPLRPLRRVRAPPRGGARRASKPVVSSRSGASLMNHPTLASGTSSAETASAAVTAADLQEQVRGVARGDGTSNLWGDLEAMGASGGVTGGAGRPR